MTRQVAEIHPSAPLADHAARPARAEAAIDVDPRRLVHATVMRSLMHWWYQWTSLGFSVRPTRLPVEWAERSNGAGLRLRSWQWWLDRRDGHAGAECRLVSIQGPRIQVLNALFLPRPAGSAPVFAADLIAIGPKRRIVFVDLQVPGMADEAAVDVGRVTRALHMGLPGLQGAPPPAWAAEHASAGVAFASTDQPRVLPTAITWYERALQAWTTLLRRAGGPPRLASSQAITAYLARHRDASPSFPFLRQTFGDPWANAYVTRFLFAPCS